MEGNNLKINTIFFKSFLQRNFLKNNKIKNSYNNFFWKEQHVFLKKKNKKIGCFVTKNGHSFSKLAHLSRFKIRQYQELGLLPLLKK